MKFITVTRKYDRGWIEVAVNVDQITCYAIGDKPSRIFTNAEYSLCFEVQETGDEITRMIRKA